MSKFVIHAVYTDTGGGMIYHRVHSRYLLNKLNKTQLFGFCIKHFQGAECLDNDFFFSNRINKYYSYLNDHYLIFVCIIICFTDKKNHRSEIGISEYMYEEYTSVKIPGCNDLNWH